MKLTIISPLQQQTHVSIKDRALNYGDGFFSTMRCVHHTIELLDRHILRLRSDAMRLGFQIDNWDELVEQLEATAHQGPATSVIKVLISRGEGGRGYSSQTALSPTAIITQNVLPENSSNFKLSIAAGYLAEQPLLAGIKHLNRLEQILFKQQADELAVDDVLCLDIHQHIIETSSANIFWFKEGHWFTPKLTRCGVNGVYRQFLLDLFAEFNIVCGIGEYPLHDIVAADSVFICNAVRGLIPVSELQLPMRTNQQTTARVSSIIDDQVIRFNNTQLPVVHALIEQQLQRVEPAL